MDQVSKQDAVEELEVVNEVLRQRLLQTLDWWEDDVIAGIEREESLREQLDNVTRQVDELTNSLPIRLTRPILRPWSFIKAKFR